MLTREEAAAYLAVSPTQFDERVRPYLPTARWGSSIRFDIRALDLYLDRLSGLDSALARSRAELDAAFGPGRERTVAASSSDKSDGRRSKRPGKTGTMA